MKTLKAYVAIDQNKNFDSKLLIATMMQVANLFSRSGIVVEYLYATLRDVDNLSPEAMYASVCDMPSLLSFSDEKNDLYSIQDPSCELCILFEKSEGFPSELYSDMFNKRYAPPMVYSFQTTKIFSIKSLIEDYTAVDSIIGTEICEK